MPYGEVKKRLLAALSDAAESERVVLVIDALDQFAPSRELTTLDFIDEQIIPKNVKIIYTALPEHKAAATRRGARVFELGRLEPNDVKKIAAGLAKRLHKDLTPATLDLIADKTSESGERVSSSPIYLVLLLELLSSFDSDDFAEIQRTQASEGLSPALAIQKYIERTILNTGADVGDVLEQISEKTILSLGEKYDLINALLTSSSDGITEEEIIGICRLTETPVTAADFSIYRRMLRIHLTERTGGRWVFNHAIIRRALLSRAAENVSTELYSAAAEYYLSLPEGTHGKHEGAVRFLGKLKRFSEVVSSAISGGDSSSGELISLLAGDGAEEILDAANDRIFELIAPVYRRLIRSVEIDTESACRIATLSISYMLKEEWREADKARTLSDVYYLLGTLLLTSGDARAASFLEISAKILTRVCPGEINTVRRALEISELYTLSEEHGAAEAYARIAYKEMTRMRSEEGDNHLFSAEVLYRLAECIRDNPLSMQGHMTGRYLAAGMSLSREAGSYDLAVRCALKYLSLPRLISKSTIRSEATSLVSEVDEGSLSPATHVARELYLAEREGSLLHAKNAYSAATMALAESKDKDTALLYAKTAEEFLYRAMSSHEANPEEVTEAAERVDRAMKKLSLITSDVTYTDRRLAIAEDVDRYVKATRAEASSPDTAEIEEEIEKELRQKGSRAKRKKDVYKSLGVKLGAIGFLAYAAVQFASFSISNHELGVARQLTLIFRNVFETFTNILAAVMLFFTLLMIYSFDKRSYDYRTDSRSFLILGGVGGLCLAASAVCDLWHVALYTSPVKFDIYFHGTTNALIYSVVFSASITWFIAYAFSIAVNRPYSGGAVQEFRNRFRRCEIALRHVSLLAISAIPAVIFLPLFFFQPRYGADYSIDMFGTTPNDYKYFCWIPLLLQAILSFSELAATRMHHGGNAVSTPSRGSVTTETGILSKAQRLSREKNLKAFASRIGIIALALIITALSCDIARIPIMAWHEGEYGYTTDGDFSYSVKNGEAELRGYHGLSKHVTVPETLGGYPVTSTKDSAFRDSDVISVILPEGLTNISYYAFSGCESLTSVYIPTTVTVIESCAFENCTSLKEIIFNGDGYVKIDHAGFEGSALCESEEVRKRGFATLGNNIAWVDVENISGAVYIPEGVTVIEELFFSSAEAITEVHLPSTLKCIGYSAFSGCAALSYINLPAGLEEIGNSAFFICKNLYYIDNLSSLNLKKGSYDYGEVARFAKVISTEGNALDSRPNTTDQTITPSGSLNPQGGIND